MSDEKCKKISGEMQICKSAFNPDLITKKPDAANGPHPASCAKNLQAMPASCFCDIALRLESQGRMQWTKHAPVRVAV